LTDEPSASTETLTRLETVARNEAFARVMGRYGFDGADLRYEDANGKRQVIVSRKAYRFIRSHNSVRGELWGAGDEQKTAKSRPEGVTDFQAALTGSQPFGTVTPKGLFY
jgi:hypothetical protein